MDLSIVEPADCAALARDVLGLGHSGADLFTREGIAASLRRAASFLCPAPPRQIVDAVFEVLSPLRPNDDGLRSEVVEVLDLLVAGRDLIELREGEDRATRLVYLGPPTYVQLEPGHYLIAGVRPFGQRLVDLDSADLAYDGHSRAISLDVAIAEAELSAQGLQLVSADTWVGRPNPETAVGLVERIGLRLDVSLPAVDAAQLLILDPSKPVRYYKGRWRGLSSGDSGLSGIFVAKREQAYGADLWCAVRIVNGAPKQLFDLPIDDPFAPGRDEAWRLQAAIDAARDTPQQYRVRVPAESENVLNFEFFAPLPGWAERRVQLVGKRLEHQSGALFAFSVSVGASESLRRFLNESLWMEEVKEEVSP